MARLRNDAMAFSSSSGVSSSWSSISTDATNRRRLVVEWQGHGIERLLVRCEQGIDERLRAEALVQPLLA